MLFPQKVTKNQIGPICTKGTLYNFCTQQSEKTTTTKKTKQKKTQKKQKQKTNKQTKTPHSSLQIK